MGQGMTSPAVLQLGSIYDHPEYGPVYLVKGSYIKDIDRIANHWTAQLIKDDGTLGDEVEFHAVDMRCLDDRYEISIYCKKKD